MNIINKKFEIKENNIFEIRKREFSNLLNIVREMLEPVKDIGFTVKELAIKPSRLIQGELFRTFKENLVIKLSKDIHDLDLSVFIPKLVDDNYIIINGRRKIPLFQLFDLPVITRGETIKLRTNIATILIEDTDEPPFIKVHFLGRLVPLALLIFCKYDKEKIFDDFKLDLLDKNNIRKDMFSKLRLDLNGYYENSSEFEHKDFLTELGRAYTDYGQIKKGESIIYALDIIPKIDLISARFFKTDSIISELVEVIKGDIENDQPLLPATEEDSKIILKNQDGLTDRSSYDDLLFTNKRLRCLEYAILINVGKSIFDLCMANRTSKTPLFNVNSSKILSDCNVSDIVQFDFSINPLDEITKLCRTSLVGPGGFKRENVPNHLRDIYPSMMGRICPVDTPDRDNCGVLQSLLPNVNLDSDLKFTDEPLKDQIISPVVSMVPFLEHDDQTRLQMASSQMRQAIKLESFDKPLIQSGCESSYTDYTRFSVRAKKDGKVVSSQRDNILNNYMFILYDDGEADMIDLSFRNNYVENFDVLERRVNEGEKFKKGDILAESSFVENGEINIGRNLLTAVMTYYGYNYEDGIIVSDRLTKRFRSAHYKNLSFVLPPNQVLSSLRDQDGDFKPLPLIGDNLLAGESYAKRKKIPSAYLYSGKVWEDVKEMTVDKKVWIERVNIYPNTWCKEIGQFREWVEMKIDSQIEKQEEVIKLVRSCFSQSKAEEIIKEKSLDKFSWIGKFRNKGERINGMLVEIGGIYFRELSVGDKIANRHGNKGVISTILPHNTMPTLENGEHVDVCINPLGIISRMNIGQLFELHLSLSLTDLKKQLNKKIDDGIDQKVIKKYLLDYIKIIDNTENNWYSKQAEEKLPEVIDSDFVEKLSIIQPPFESVTFKQLDKAMKYTNTPYKQKVYDPHTKGWLVNEIATGYLYFVKLVHIAEDRLAARGIGSYTRRTLQPPGGRKLLGGQRLGEMEVNAIIGQGGIKNLNEMLTTKSDCIDLKNKFIKESVETALISDSEKVEDKVPESLHLFNAYLTVIGLKH